MAEGAGDRRGWHVDKGIPIAVIITVIVLAVGGMRHLGKQDERLSNVELNIEHLKQSRLADQMRAEKKYDDLKTDLRVIGAKIDRLNENLTRRD
ncbi:hypothetical protein [Marinobacter sp.]|uniref:hypothetical protein n=1 Tax=Marinobacter sp. TaxID=50741 RepID=UPI003A94DDEE